MKRNGLWLWIAASALVLFLFACTTLPGAVPTKTLEPTPTPQPMPKPGAKLAGDIEISGKASSATILIAVSENGSSITSVSVSLKDVKCESFSAGSLMQSAQASIPITQGEFAASLSSIGEIKGKFTGPSEAKGTIAMNLKTSVLGSTIGCDLGTWNWSAKGP